MRDAEIFAYAVVESRLVDGAEELLLCEVPRSRTIPDFAKVVDGLTEFLKRESENRDGELVYLGEEDGLDLSREVPRTEFWTVASAWLLTEKHFRKVVGFRDFWALSVILGREENPNLAGAKVA